MQPFLKRLVDVFKDLTIQVDDVTFRVLLLLCVADLPAKASVLNMKQVNVIRRIHKSSLIVNFQVYETS